MIALICNNPPDEPTVISVVVKEKPPSSSSELADESADFNVDNSDGVNVIVCPENTVPMFLLTTFKPSRTISTVTPLTAPSSAATANEKYFMPSRGNNKSLCCLVEPCKSNRTAASPFLNPL